MSDPDDDRPGPGMWSEPAPGKLIGRGHGVGDFLEAHEWDVLEQSEDVLRVRAHLPTQVRNARGQLFGGFTPTYVDLISILTFRAGRPRRKSDPWLATLNMRIDYFAPIVADGFEIEARIVHRNGSTVWVETRFRSPEGAMLVYAYTTLKAV